MKILISPISVSEAKIVAAGGADIIDVKNPREGSLGANFPWVIAEVVEAISRYGVTCSATLGDLPYKPGTAALAAIGAAHSGARYIKAGLYGIRDLAEATEVMTAVAKACKSYDGQITVVAAGYADYRRFGGIDPMTVIAAAKASGSDVAMVDTAIKDGQTLFDNMSRAEIETFVVAGRATGLKVALAGSVRREHLPQVFAADPDIIGVRGAVCEGTDRNAPIRQHLVELFVEQVRQRALA